MRDFGCECDGKCCSRPDLLVAPDKSPPPPEPEETTKTPKVGCSKIFFVKIENVGKFEISIKNGNQKLQKTFYQVEVLVPKLKSENYNFDQKSPFWSKIEILVKTRNFGDKFSTFW